MAVSHGTRSTHPEHVIPELRCRRLVVEDECGRERIVGQADVDGGLTVLELKDGRGSLVISMDTDDDFSRINLWGGGTCMLSLCCNNKTGTVTAFSHENPRGGETSEFELLDILGAK